MCQSKLVNNLLLLCLLLALLMGATVQAGSDLTHEEVAAVEREYTYTTAAAVAAGQRAAERYWQNEYRYRDLIAAEREFTYTTAKAVAEGKAAAEAYYQAQR